MNAGKVILLLFIVFQLNAYFAEANAATYYVSTSGNDANQGTLASPWRHIAYAVTRPNLQPGDIIYVRGGIYNAEAIQPSISGSDTNPITLMAYNGEIPEITGGNPNGLGGIIFHSDSGNGGNGRITNWIIDGFSVHDTAENGNGGGISLSCDGTNSTTGTITIQNNTLYNNQSGDNPAGVYIARCFGNIIVKNNRIHDNSGSVGCTCNNVGIVIFGLIGSSSYSNIVIDHNEIYNEAVAIKSKHPTGTNGQLIVRYNLVHDISGRSGIETVQPGTKIYNNIVYNLSGSEAAAVIAGQDFDVNNVEIYNNSVYNVSWGVYVQANSTNVNIHDNVFYTFPNSGIQGYGLFLGQTATTVSDYNLFYNGLPANWGGYGGGVAQTLLQLQAHGLDLHSKVANPLYVGPTADFHLQTTSPAKRMGTTQKDVGAYPTGSERIGLLSEIIPPAPPLNLQVR